jgi:hypothetical protein
LLIRLVEETSTDTKGNDDMNTSGMTTPLCAHCGRPVIFAAVWHGGRAYHYECTQSPHKQQFQSPLPSKN